MLGIRSGKLFIGDLRSRHIWCPGHGGDLVLTEEAFNVQMDRNQPQIILIDHVREHIGDCCHNVQQALQTPKQDVTTHLAAAGALQCGWPVTWMRTCFSHTCFVAANLFSH